MPTSEEISRSFYGHLGADGLARRTRPDWDAAILRALLQILPRTGHVLDVGCGYGRISVPLAHAGYAVDGLDLSPNLVRTARDAAAVERIDASFVVGSMTAMPYPAGSFDAVICLWSAFHELLEETEQLEAIREMRRVLRPGRRAVIEGPTYAEPTVNEIDRGERRGHEHRVAWGLVDGLLNPHYAHDARSLSRVCEAAGVTSFEVLERDWGGRQRLLLHLDA